MEASFKQDSKLNKAERYQFFLTQLTPLIEGERNEVSVLANTSAALKEAFGFFWVGFYWYMTVSFIWGLFRAV